MVVKNRHYLVPLLLINQWLRKQLTGSILSAGLIVAALLSACTVQDSSDNGEKTDLITDEVVIYSPAPSQIMMHAHNVELGDTLRACGIAKNIRVIPVALPDSINQINTLDASVKPYHLPIITTLDFKTAIEGNAPDWHGYTEKNPDLRFVASLYDVAFGLFAVRETIQSPADLAGKRIAVPARPSAVRWFTEALLRDGWRILDRVTLIDMVPPEVPAAIARGEVDVVAWNIMSETPAGYRPLLPMIFSFPGAHWLDIDLTTVEAINSANPFKTEQVVIRSDSVIGVSGQRGKTAQLLSFRQGLAAWNSTPDELITAIANCMAQADFGFGSGLAFADRQFSWPHLSPSDVHPALNVANLFSNKSLE